MGINFSAKILITNPTTFYMGLSVACAGILAIVVGVTTYYVGDFLMPASAWIALGIPMAGVGGILIPFGLTKS